MAKAKDLTGQTFGRLKVIKRVDNYIKPNGTQESQWLCECNCIDKTLVVVRGWCLNNGNTQSCGCLQKERLSKKRKKYNMYDLSGEYGIGHTSKGEEFWFDLEDYNLIKDYCWMISNNGYVITDTSKSSIRMPKIFFHRLVMNCPNDLFIDHQNHNKIDNRKNNLRIVTKSQNAMNQVTKTNNTSGTTGVSWDSKVQKWAAHIMINCKKMHLGYFDEFEDAVRARKCAEDEHFGEFSYDNSMKTEHRKYQESLKK